MIENNVVLDRVRRKLLKSVENPSGPVVALFAGGGVGVNVQLIAVPSLSDTGMPCSSCVADKRFDLCCSLNCQAKEREDEQPVYFEVESYYEGVIDANGEWVMSHFSPPTAQSPSRIVEANEVYRTVMNFNSEDVLRFESIEEWVQDAPLFGSNDICGAISLLFHVRQQSSGRVFLNDLEISPLCFAQTAGNHCCLPQDFVLVGRPDSSRSIKRIQELLR